METFEKKVIKSDKCTSNMLFVIKKKTKSISKVITLLILISIFSCSKKDVNVGVKIDYKRNVTQNSQTVPIELTNIEYKLNGTTYNKSTEQRFSSKEEITIDLVNMMSKADYYDAYVIFSIYDLESSKIYGEGRIPLFDGHNYKYSIGQSMLTIKVSN